MEHTKTAILLATYNGAAYLREQLDSLFRQSYTDWTLYIHDDGSTDGTLQILEEYAHAHDNVVLLKYGSTHGACANFLSMLKAVEADYYFFCDQDDVWDEDKVRISLNAMHQAEQEQSDKPIIIHTDLYVANERLDIIETSFMRYIGIHPEHITNLNQCVEPFVTGCTMLLNAAARKAADRPSQYALMHDVWLTICTMKEGGKVVYVNIPTVFYRQHGTNSVGARDIQSVTWLYRMSHAMSIIEHKWEYYRMLQSVGYGSPLKYAFYKARFHNKVKRKQ